MSHSIYKYTDHFIAVKLVAGNLFSSKQDSVPNLVESSIRIR